jgi:predicted nuclease of predicted toxin-antitoxin system
MRDRVGIGKMTWVNIEVLVKQNPPTQKEAQQVLDYLARRAKARFYADEDFPAQAVHLVREMGAKVRTNREAGLSGHDDGDQLAYARRNGMILLSCDRDLLDERRYPIVHCPAIFVFDFGSGSSREMKQTFWCIAGALRMPQFFDKWWKVDAKRDCWTELVRHQDGSTSRHRQRLWRGKIQE